MSLELHSTRSETGALDTSAFSGLDTPAPLGRYREEKPSLGPATSFHYRIVKRFLDIALILLASPIIVPVLLLIAVAVRLSSPGPVFFTHRRIRAHGSFFSMWKFRTMCQNSAEILDAHLAANPAARAEWLRTHKLRNDPRITPIGNFLRRTSLDELPQLWNVLTGSMSLVGPRPIVAAEVEKYGEHFADYCRVKPGITGLWQVSGRSEVTYDQRVKLDATYAREWSLSQDALILARTFTSVVNQNGAY
jgi:Undecaprenyl-phosphate galactose phosphotransferase WbaP